MEAESEIKSIDDIQMKLGELYFPFEEVVPEILHDWFTILAKSHGTTRELLLLSSLTTASALLGKTSVEVFETYEEMSNIFLIAVAPSGSGKTPACHLGCIDPIVYHLERKIDSTILLDVTSASGLFNQVCTNSSVPFICIDEANAFLTKVAFPTKSSSQMDLSMERLCKLFDRDCWYVLKGSKGKRTGTSSAKASMLAFTTPHQFFQKAWPRILGAENGLAERVFFFYQPKVEKDLEDMADQCKLLKDLTVKSFKTVFENIYNEHNGENVVKYKLDASGREAFFKFAKPQENITPPSQNTSVSGKPKCSNAKRNAQVLRAAVSMHALYCRLSSAIHLETEATPGVIPLSTVNMAIVLVETLETYKGISEACCQLSPKDSQIFTIGISEEETESGILKIPGPFTTAKRVYTSFTSKNRPSSKIVETAMKNLEKKELGTFKTINKLKVFYKKEPSEEMKSKLIPYNMSLDNYREIYNSVDIRLISRDKDILERNV